MPILLLVETKLPLACFLFGSLSSSLSHVIFNEILLALPSAPAFALGHSLCDSLEANLSLFRSLFNRKPFFAYLNERGLHT